MSTETSVPFLRVSPMNPVDAALAGHASQRSPHRFRLLHPRPCFQRVNRTLATIYGRSADECYGRTPDEVLPPPTLQSTSGPFPRSWLANPWSTATTISSAAPPDAPTRNGTGRCPGSPPTTDGEVTGVALIAVDISERHKAELALRRSEERYRALMQASNQIVWAAERDGRVDEDCPEWRALDRPVARRSTWPKAGSRRCTPTTWSAPGWRGKTPSRTARSSKTTSGSASAAASTGTTAPGSPPDPRQPGRGVGRHARRRHRHR